MSYKSDAISMDSLMAMTAVSTGATIEMNAGLERFLHSISAAQGVGQPLGSTRRGA